MYTVIALINGHDKNRVEMAVGDVKSLFNVLYILETSDTVDTFKVVDSDNGVVSSLKQFGWGDFAKFCIKFDFGEREKTTEG